MSNSILQYTMGVYLKNFELILMAAVPGLFGLILPLVVGMPSYIALGGTYLRTGSIVDLNYFGVTALIISVLISLYLMSFAIVGINLVVKRQRTLKKISAETLGSVAKMTNSVFVVYLIATILLLLVQLFTYETQLQRIIAPVLNLIIGFGMLFLPTAMVMDEVRSFRALQRGVTMLFAKPIAVLQWVVIALVLLSAMDLLFLTFVDFVTFVPRILGQWAVMVFNSLIILPFLIVMLAQIYINKYTILVD